MQGPIGSNFSRPRFPVNLHQGLYLYVLDKPKLNYTLPRGPLKRGTQLGAIGPIDLRPVLTRGMYGIDLGVPTTRTNKQPRQTICISHYRCHYTKSNPIDDHSNISSKRLQKQNFKPLGHYTCMQCVTSHLQKVQENILSHIILATYRKFTVATVRFTQNVSCNIFTHPIYQQVANVTV